MLPTVNCVVAQFIHLKPRFGATLAFVQYRTLDVVHFVLFRSRLFENDPCAGLVW